MAGCEEPVQDVVGRPQRLYCTPVHRNAARQARRTAAQRERQARSAEVAAPSTGPIPAREAVFVAGTVSAEGPVPDRSETAGAALGAATLAIRAAYAQEQWLAAAATPMGADVDASGGGPAVALPEHGALPDQGDLPGHGGLPDNTDLPDDADPDQADLSSDDQLPDGELPDHGEVAGHGELPDRADLPEWARPEWARHAGVAPGPTPNEPWVLGRLRALSARARTAEPPPAHRRALAVIGAAGLVAGGYALAPTEGPPATPPVPVPTVVTSEARWVARAEVTVTSIDRQLDQITKTEEILRQRRPAAPPEASMRALEDRKALLQQRRAVLASQIDTVRSLHRARQDLVLAEDQLRAVQEQLRNAPAASRRSPEQQEAATALDEQHEMRQRQRDATRKEITALERDAATAVRTPLPDDGPRTSEITDNVLGAQVPAPPDAGSGQPSAPAGPDAGTGRPSLPDPAGADRRSDPPMTGNAPVPAGPDAAGRLPGSDPAAAERRADPTGSPPPSAGSTAGEENARTRPGRPAGKAERTSGRGDQNRAPQADGRRSTHRSPRPRSADDGDAATAPVTSGRTGSDRSRSREYDSSEPKSRESDSDERRTESERARDGDSSAERKDRSRGSDSDDEDRTDSERARDGGSGAEPRGRTGESGSDDDGVDSEHRGSGTQRNDRSSTNEKGSNRAGDRNDSRSDCTADTSVDRKSESRKRPETKRSRTQKSEREHPSEHRRAGTDHDESGDRKDESGDRSPTRDHERRHDHDRQHRVPEAS